MIPGEDGAKLAVSGQLVKVLTHRRDDRGMTLEGFASRCVRRGEVHELVTTDHTEAAAGARIDRVGFLGFVEIGCGGVIDRGDEVWAGGGRVGTVLGFDACHFPNHYNILITVPEPLTGPQLGLAPEAEVRFEQRAEERSPGASMNPRINLAELEPAAYQAMVGLEQYLASSPLPAPLRELVKLRASQLNGCSFCVELHRHQAGNGGETDERLSSLVRWRASPCFSAAERAALALTEAATRLGTEGVPDAVWDEAAAHFDDRQLAALVMTVATVNAWNRIAVSTGLAAKRAGGFREHTEPQGTHLT
ncbi:carboxymuconolactone decarboxylase family protein [Streptomyces sp. NPDC006140]|uniref:carboxymuconolactone decarboxylase family protein n=1 Tax=Streptomyces sp. NPDC006140 TaxID=3154579 RepID=UPI0033ED9A1C